MICDDPDCGGERHECHDCGGDGFVESDDWQDLAELFPCSTCQGQGGWPCPDAKLRWEDVG